MPAASPPPGRPGCRIGCAGWRLPPAEHDSFPAEGSHLQRYAARFCGVEINSSFHRPHSHATYARWAAGVPEHFRFCVKLPKTVTHEHGLVDCAGLLDAFLAQAAGLGPRLSCLLVQLPPKLDFDATTARAFFALLRERWPGDVAVEPRHASWFAPEAEAMLTAARAARVLADPVLHPTGERPGGWPAMAYLRLHGSPRRYYSSYEPQTIAALARRIRRALGDNQEVWCIFDNTASGAAAHNALLLKQCLEKDPA